MRGPRVALGAAGAQQLVLALLAVPSADAWLDLNRRVFADLGFAASGLDVQLVMARLGLAVGAAAMAAFGLALLALAFLLDERRGWPRIAALVGGIVGLSMTLPTLVVLFITPARWHLPLPAFAGLGTDVGVVATIASSLLEPLLLTIVGVDLWRRRSDSQLVTG